MRSGRARKQSDPPRGWSLQLLEIEVNSARENKVGRVFSIDHPVALTFRYLSADSLAHLAAELTLHPANEDGVRNHRHTNRRLTLRRRYRVSACTEQNETTHQDGCPHQQTRTPLLLHFALLERAD